MVKKHKLDVTITVRMPLTVQADNRDWARESLERLQDDEILRLVKQAVKDGTAELELESD